MYDHLDGQFSDVIDTIHAAGVSPELWPKVLETFSKKIGGDAAVTFHVTQTSASGKPEATFLHKNYEDKAIELYSEHYMYMSPWTKANMAARPGEAYCAHEVCPPSTFIDSEFFYDWVRPYNVPKVGASIKLFQDEGQFGTLCMNYDERKAELIDDHMPHILKALLPHIKIAIRNNRYLQDANLKGAHHQSLVNMTKKPAFLVSGNRHVVYSNALGEIVLRQGRGVRHSPGGRIALTDHKENEEFSIMVRDTADLRFSPNEYGGAMTFTASDKSYNNIIEATPLRCGSENSIFNQGIRSNLVFLVLQYRDDRQVVDQEYLIKLFGFTKKEAEVAAALVEGKSSSEHALDNKRSKHTVRSHLKSAMAKTDCNSQAKMVQLIVNMENAWRFSK